MLTALILAAATPSPDAVALGRRLARTGTLAALLPLVVAKDTDDLIAEHRALSEADRARLRQVAMATARAQMERVLDAQGDAYARALSAADLRALVAHAESPAGRHHRAALPGVIAGTMGAVGDVNYKLLATEAFCRETGKLCASAPRP